jgi:hypothetical protein
MDKITSRLKIEWFGNRRICYGGIGKMFYQDGFPISMAVEKLREDGIEVSILHVADECLKNGWSAKTVLTKLKDDFSDFGGEYGMNEIERFCNASYEEQRAMIFEYLFNGDRELAKEHLRGDLNLLKFG